MSEGAAADTAEWRPRLIETLNDCSGNLRPSLREAT